MLSFRRTWNIMKMFISNIVIFIYNDSVQWMCIYRPKGHWKTYCACPLGLPNPAHSPGTHFTLLRTWALASAMPQQSVSNSLQLWPFFPWTLWARTTSQPTLTGSHPSDVLSSGGWSCPSVPLLPYSWLDWCIGTWPLLHPDHIFSLALKFFTQSTF